MGTWQRAAFDFAVDGAVALAGAAARERRSTPYRASAIEGVNDWSQGSVAGGGRPVVLVHGTGVGSDDTWREIAPALVAEGRRVFALEHGRRRGVFDGNLVDRPGGGDMVDAAKELADFIESIRSVTGAAQVDVVAHSQGGLVARQYLRFEGGADRSAPGRNKARKLITLGATHHGTTFGSTQLVGMAAGELGLPLGALSDVALGRSMTQQLVGSSFLARLNEGGDTEPGVEYTVVASRNDQICTPPERTFLTEGDGSVVRNLWVQDVDPSAVVDHMQLCTDDRVIRIVRQALDGFCAGSGPRAELCS